MQLIPLQAIPNQTVTTQLDSQSCLIKVYQRRYGLFVDLYVSDVLVIGGVIAQNLNRIVRSLYFNFNGDFIFADSQGSQDPDYTGLADRYEFLYLTVDNLTSLGLMG